MGINIVKNRLKALLELEAEKYAKRGYYCIIAYLLFYAYFVYIPQILLICCNYASDYSKATIYIFGSFLVHFIIYIIMNSAFALVYMLNTQSSNNWRVSSSPWPWKTDPNFFSQVRAVAINTFINQFFMAPMMSLIGSFALKLRFQSEEFPSLLVNLKQVIIFMLIEDSIYYWSHRLTHWGIFYKYFHKKHHEFKVTISISSEYIHPVEYVLANILPLGAGPFFYGSQHVHIVTWFTWLAFRSIHTAEGHSGFNIPWSPMRLLPFGVSAEFHDNHHGQNLGNYGSMFVIWDTIMGTNEEVKLKTHLE